MAMTGNYIVIPRSHASYATIISDCTTKHASEAPGTTLSVAGLNDESVMIKVKNGDATWRNAQAWIGTVTDTYDPADADRLTYYNSVSSFSPRSLANLKLWLDFSDLSNGTVATWDDRSTNSKDAVQATETNKPTKDADGVYFDGVDNFLTCGVASDWTFLHNGTGSTVFIVFKLDDRTGIKGLLTTILTVDGIGMGFGYYAVDDAVYNLYNTLDPVFATNVSTNNIFADTGFSVKGICFDGTNAIIFDEDMNTSSVTTEGTASSSAPDSALTIGGIAGTYFFKGWIKEIIVYSDNKTTLEKQTLINYLETKYSL